MPDEPALPDPSDAPAKPKLSLASDLFNIGEEAYKEVAQSLLIAMQNARNIENGVIAFAPIASAEANDILSQIKDHALQIHTLSSKLYARIAATAFHK